MRGPISAEYVWSKTNNRRSVSKLWSRPIIDEKFQNSVRGPIIDKRFQNIIITTNQKLSVLTAMFGEQYFYFKKPIKSQ